MKDHGRKGKQTMKRIIALLCVLMLPLAWAAGEAGNEGSMIQTDVSSGTDETQDALARYQQAIAWMWDNPDAAMAYERVLRYNEPFIYCPNEDGSGSSLMTLDEYRDMIWDQYVLTRQTCMDLDGDGSMEYVLKISVRGYDADWGYLILNDCGGQIYGRALTNRAMMNLRADGSFEYVSGGSAYGIATLRLDGAAWETVPRICFVLTEGGTVCYVDGEPADPEAFTAALQREYAKPEPIWGAFRSVSWVERIDALTAYQQALRNEITVRYTSYCDGGEMDPVWRETALSDLAREEYGEGFALTRFALIDLDMDEVPEMVLEVTETAYYGFPFAFIVLKAETDGAVYAHEFVYRAMEDLKADGTFGFSSGAMDCGFGRAWLHFARHGITNVTWCESGDDMETVYYLSLIHI